MTMDDQQVPGAPMDPGVTPTPDPSMPPVPQEPVQPPVEPAAPEAPSMPSDPVVPPAPADPAMPASNDSAGADVPPAGNPL